MYFSTYEKSTGAAVDAGMLLRLAQEDTKQNRFKPHRKSGALKQADDQADHQRENEQAPQNIKVSMLENTCDVLTDHVVDRIHGLYEWGELGPRLQTLGVCLPLRRDDLSLR